MDYSPWSKAANYGPDESLDLNTYTPFERSLSKLSEHHKDFDQYTKVMAIERCSTTTPPRLILFFFITLRTSSHAVHFQMADKVLADIAKKNFTFDVDGDMLTADSAYDKNNGPSPVQLSNTANPVVDIVLAVVFTIILIIVIVVVVIIVVYCYR